jgi:hypothetical protein
VSDLETTVRGRLQHLADDLTPIDDPVLHVRGARVRYRRQRRIRVTALSVLAAVVVLAAGVPASLGAFTASPSGGEVAGPGATTSPTAEESLREDARENAERVAEREGVLDRAAERDAELRPSVERLGTALAARTAPLSLTGPATGSCPGWAADLSTALGAAVDQSTGDLASGCRWSGSSGADVAVEVEFVPGTTHEQFTNEVNAEAALGDCYVSAMPGTATLTALILCDEDGGTSWRLRVVDSSLTGHWRLTTTLGEGHAGDQAAPVAAVVELADAAW